MATWLTPADQMVIKVARLIARNGLSLVEAMQAAGVTWSQKHFFNLVANLLKKPGVGVETAKMLGEAVQLVAGEGLVAGATGAGAAGAGGAAAGGGAASGGLLAFIVAHPFLFIGGLIAAGIAVYGAADVAGRMMADAPSAVAGPKLEIACPPNTQPSGRRCLPITRTRCSTGTAWVNGRCEPTKASSDCPEGFRRCGDRCIGWRMTCFP